MTTEPQLLSDPKLEIFPCPHTPGVLRFRRPSNILISESGSTHIHDKIIDLITELQAKRPGWQFVVGNSVKAYLYIYNKDKEYLGEVDYVVAYYGGTRDYYQLKNFRIREQSNKTTTGRCYSTSKAVERILAKFRPKNMDEVVKARGESAAEAISNIVSGARSKWMLSKQGAKRNDIALTVLNNPEAFANTPVAPLVTSELIQEWQAYKSAMVLSNKADFEIVTEVERDGAKQLYSITGVPEAYWLDAEQHKELISKIAMLRMVDVGQVVAGIGFRSDDHTFVVIT